MNQNIDNIPHFHSQLSQKNINRKTILLIDDSLDLLELNSMLLEMEGHQVLCAQSGKAAFEIIQETEKLDLILLDLCMEDMNGIEFLRQFELNSPDIFAVVPVVIMSGVDEIPANRPVPRQRASR